MHNSLNRLQTTFGFFTTCAFTLAALISFLSVLPFPSPESAPSASISVRNVQVVKGRPHYYSPTREEYAQIRFDLDADLSPLFSWNTKQVFVYVSVNYPTGFGFAGTEGQMSQAVIWDTIIPATSTPYAFQNLKTRFEALKAQYYSGKTSKRSSTKNKKKFVDKSSIREVAKSGVLSLKNQKPKYQVTDPTGVVSRRSNATLQVSWNVQPWVGALVWDKGYLGGRVGKWEAGKVGASETFDFPPLKGSKTNVVKNEEGPKTPSGGEAAPAVGV